MLLVVTALTLSACDFDVYELPLPGGPDVGYDPMTVTVHFADVLDLVPKSTVKVNDVTVGQVHRRVPRRATPPWSSLEMRDDVELPDNAVAEIRQTSLLGEKFVSLAAPAEGASGNPLESGDEIPLERTGRNPEVEEVLGALSLLLNGGGVAPAPDHHPGAQPRARGPRGDRPVGAAAGPRLHAASSTTTRATSSTRSRSSTGSPSSIREEQPTIDAALEELPSALDSIDRQREDLVTMLESLEDLSAVGVEVIRGVQGRPPSTRSRRSTRC